MKYHFRLILISIYLMMPDISVAIYRDPGDDYGSGDIGYFVWFVLGMVLLVNYEAFQKSLRCGAISIAITLLLTVLFFEFSEARMVITGVFGLAFLYGIISVLKENI